MLLAGAGRDAAYVADRLAARMRQAARAHRWPPDPPYALAVEVPADGRRRAASRRAPTSTAVTGAPRTQRWSAAGPDALSAEELEDLATAAELLGHHDDAVAALQRAFRR